ncbi:MAG: HNH endonuclease [Blastocatellia bacterium]
MSKSMAKHRTWTNDELLVVFRLYCRTPFGRLHQRNPEIIQLAQSLGRTPSAVAMKACNFASLDPVQKARNISALGNVSRADRELWMAFEQNSEAIAADAETVYEKLLSQIIEPEDVELELPEGPTEVERLVRTRRVQGFFRAAVLTSYELRCALSDIAIPDLLNASHIIPWSANTERRADPRNGIALNALYDRAFDRGFITFDESLKLVISSRLKEGSLSEFQKESFLHIEGKKLRIPYRFDPDPDAMTYHREKVFRP